MTTDTPRGKETKERSRIVMWLTILGFGAGLMAFVFGESDSRPMTSSDLLSAKRLYEEVLDDLKTRKNPSFCTFERVGDTTVWLQVNGSELDQAACSWPKDRVPVRDSIQKAGISIPAGFKLIEDKFYEGRRVILFDCDTMLPTEWAAFIDAVFKNVHELPGETQFKCWVTRGE